MAKKRKIGRRPKQKQQGPQKSRRGKPLASSDFQSHLSDNILAFLADNDEPASHDEIMAHLEPVYQSPKQFKQVLGKLEESGKIERSGKRYILSGGADLLKASLQLTARGFGFAVPEEPKPGDKDIFIAKDRLNGASHADTVLVRVIGTSRGRREGRVVKVLERGVTKLCGIFNSGGKISYITPDNDRLPYTVQVRRANIMGAKDGMAVLAEIIDFGTGAHPPEGKIIKVLGDPATVDVQLIMAIEQFKLPRSFPEEVEAETNALKALNEVDEGRVDLRDIPHVTIDGATAKDFDDAVAVVKNGKGFTLYVSIADVSHYVKPGSPVDREAYSRGTSVYLPDMVLPMLPERLSNNLCSLVPDENRPAFSAIMDFDEHGKRTRSRFVKSLIKSRQRFTYDTVNQIVYLGDDRAAAEYEQLMPTLKAAAKLAALLAKRRAARGSIGFNIPEAVVSLENGEIKSISRAERNQAHLLIEEFMLAANEAVAEALDVAKKPVLFRIHELPDPNKVEEFRETAKSLGLQLPKKDTSPAWFAKVVENATNSPAEYVVNNLLLRTMQQARYAPDNVGHFGLAAQYYLHFTSPIRRYPDLVAHRVLQDFLIKGDREKTAPRLLPDKKTSLADSGMHLSKRERIAIDVERNVQARMAALFLRDRVGDEFEAVISGVSSFGLFVELVDLLISGAVPLRDMRDDYYIHDAKAHRVIGELSGVIYQLGDLVRARLEHVDLLAKRLTFSLLPRKEKVSLSEERT